MKVGTDAVLLGAWVDLKGAGRILDVGTGTGLIAIMMAQRSGALIDAVEIDRQACLQARENVAACPWNQRITIFHDTFQHFAENATASYDVIISNPPYFRDSLKPPSRSRSLARHDDRLSLESLLFYTSRLLNPRGRLAVITPAANLDNLMAVAAFNNLYPVKQVTVFPIPGKQASRSLVTFTSGWNLPCETSSLVIRNAHSHDYTDDYKDLTKAFYL